MKRSGLFVIFLTLLFTCHGSALGQDFFPEGDARVNSYYRNVTYGHYPELYSGDQQRGDNLTYIRFDLQNTPEEIESARLVLHNTKLHTTSSTGSVSVYRVSEEWSEMNVSWLNKPAYDVEAITSTPIVNQWTQPTIEFDLTELYRNWKDNTYPNFGIVLNTDGSSSVSYYSMYYGFYPGTFYSKEYNNSNMRPRLVVVPAETNRPPVVDAGDNCSVLSDGVVDVTITGKASDPDGDALSYQWSTGGTLLGDRTAVDAEGKAVLDLSAHSGMFTRGEYTLMLSVDDGQAISSDTMQLIVENSAPTVAVQGGGSYEYPATVELRGAVADFDGDLLNYEWSDGVNAAFCSGEINSASNGLPVDLPVCAVTGLDFGIHRLYLSVSDTDNEPVTGEIEVNITDWTTPTLAPVADRTILWPPNHRMKKVVITTHANDNSGFPVDLTASVSSNEAQDGLFRRDRSPDWSEPEIDPANGVITVKLRAERAFRGDGRTYTILVTATDLMGNSSESALEVVVPRCRGKRYDKIRRHIRQRIQERREQRMESYREKMQERRERIAAQRERIKDRLERIRERWEDRRNRRR